MGPRAYRSLCRTDGVKLAVSLWFEDDGSMSCYDTLVFLGSQLRGLLSVFPAVRFHTLAFLGLEAASALELFQRARSRRIGFGSKQCPSQRCDQPRVAQPSVAEFLHDWWSNTLHLSSTPFFLFFLRHTPHQCHCHSCLTFLKTVCILLLHLAFLFVFPSAFFFLPLNSNNIMASSTPPVEHLHMTSTQSDFIQWKNAFTAHVLRAKPELFDVLQARNAEGFTAAQNGLFGAQLYACLGKDVLSFFQRQVEDDFIFHGIELYILVCAHFRAVVPTEDLAEDKFVSVLHTLTRDRYSTTRLFLLGVEKLKNDMTFGGRIVPFLERVLVFHALRQMARNKQEPWADIILARYRATVRAANPDHFTVVEACTLRQLWIDVTEHLTGDNKPAQGRPVCTSCHKPGHTADKCWSGSGSGQHAGHAKAGHSGGGAGAKASSRTPRVNAVIAEDDVFPGYADEPHCSTCGGVCQHGSCDFFN